MPLTVKGKRIKEAMVKHYGSAKKGKQVFYASQKKGTITGTHILGQTKNIRKK